METAENIKKHHSARIVLYDAIGNIALFVRSETSSVRAGGIDLLGGAVEVNETSDLTVIRETEEESGLIVSRNRLLILPDQPYTRTRKDGSISDVDFYVGRVDGIKPKLRLNKESSEGFWAHFVDAFELLDQEIQKRAVMSAHHGKYFVKFAPRASIQSI